MKIIIIIIPVSGIGKNISFSLQLQEPVGEEVKLKLIHKQQETIKIKQENHNMGTPGRETESEVDPGEAG